MGIPKIDFASLRCPQCAGLTKLVGITRIDSFAGNERFSFECNECGSFEVLAVADSNEEVATDRYLAKPGTELQDLWA